MARRPKHFAHGASLDAAPSKSLWDGSPAGQGATKDFDLDARIATVQGANKQTITGMELTAARRAGETRVGNLKGRIGDGRVTATGSGGETRLVTSDAGAPPRFANLNWRLEGGDLNLILRSHGDSNEGEATLTDFVLRDEPAFRQPVTAGRPRASEDDAAAIDPSVLRFDKMTASFERAPGRWRSSTVVYNPSMGLTAQGEIDFTHNQIDVSRLVRSGVYGQQHAD